jgi:methylthioribose-1-phosphate isomerase
MATETAAGFRPITWLDHSVSLIDQTRLPSKEVWLRMEDFRDVVSAIKEMQIRGAPAIGVAGAYAVALAARELEGGRPRDFLTKLEAAAIEIREARPTGANLSWAVERMMRVARRPGPIGEVVDTLVAEARIIHEEDERANLRMGELGASLIPNNSAVLTHCNTGALATGGHGTALGVIRTAWAQGRVSRVYATETRPLLQGARLTAWELARAGIDATLVPDSAAGQLLQRGGVAAVIVGADRIAANGDVANKIGTYSLAVLSAENDVPFYVAAPTSTVDPSIPTGADIPIEERSPEEVTHVGSTRMAAEGVDVSNPAFDVTPNRYVTAIITEHAVVRRPYDAGLAQAVEAGIG